jgi:hypothetical protein
VGGGALGCIGPRRIPSLMLQEASCVSEYSLSFLPLGTQSTRGRVRPADVRSTAAPFLMMPRRNRRSTEGSGLLRHALVGSGGCPTASCGNRALRAESRQRHTFSMPPGVVYHSRRCPARHTDRQASMTRRGARCVTVLACRPADLASPASSSKEVVPTGCAVRTWWSCWRV